MTDRHPGEDVLLDLALAEVDEHQRDELTRHLALCEPCRAAYAALADSVDHVLVAAPRVAPTPGFSRSVLAAMGLGGADTAPVDGVATALAARQGGGGVPVTPRAADGARRPRARRRRWTPIAAAAALGLLVGGAGAVLILDSPQPAVVEAAAVGPALVTQDGSRVGTVLDSWFDGEPVLVVTVTDGRVGVGYECVLVYADGNREVVGSWVLDEAAGATWVVAHPDSGLPVTAVELVTDAGTTWATASL